MATLVERFGNNVTIDYTTPANPKLILTLANLQNTPDGQIINGMGLDDVALITNSTQNDYADKLMAALFILNLQKQPSTNTIADNGIWINPLPNRSFVTRANIPQVAYTYAITFYKNDTLINLNPELIV
jgi:hypothetical protein